MRVILLVINGFGIGELADASHFGDEGANTYGAVKAANIENLRSLGLDNIFGIDGESVESTPGAYGRVRTLSRDKSTLTCYRELCGNIRYYPPADFRDGIPDSDLKKLNRIFGRVISAAGREKEVLEKYGEESEASSAPIVYIGNDNVLRVLAHERAGGLAELSALSCKAIKALPDIERISARTFTGKDGKYCLNEQTFNACAPEKSENMLSRLSRNGIKSVLIGNVGEFFGNADVYVPCVNDEEVFRAVISEEMQTSDNAFIFGSFGDADTIYGHSRDVEGYIRCLEKLDGYIGKIISGLFDDDLLFITSNHGNDPSLEAHFEHTREYLPLLVYGKAVSPGVDLHTLHGLNIIAHTILDAFKIVTTQYSILNELMSGESQAKLMRAIRNMIKKGDK